MAPMKCVTCKTSFTKVNSGSTCSTCKKNFHWNCSNLTEKVIRELASGRTDQWNCLQCDKRKSTSSGPVPSVKSKDLTPAQPLLTSDDIESNASLQSIQRIDSVVTEMRRYLDEKFAELHEITRVLNDHGHRINQIEDNNKTFSFNLKNLDIRVDNIEQAALSFSVEISGIPSVQPDNISDIARKVGSAISCPISTDDWTKIYRQHRQTNQDKPPTIVISFKDLSKRDEFMAAARTNRGLTTTKLGINGNESFIFVNELLTMARKKLFYTAKVFKNANNYKYLWTRRGKIYLRKNDGSQAINVNFYTNFDRLDGSC